jgi:leucyl-tRNA synthetase
VSDPFYVTTPLFYVNAEPHLGHAYVAIVGDTLARFWRARGREVFSLTGTDEHGDKIQQAAAAAGVTPKAHADRVSGIFRETWEKAGLRYDHFIRTTDAYHVAFVRRVLAEIHARGDITSRMSANRFVLPKVFLITPVSPPFCRSLLLSLALRKIEEAGCGAQPGAIPEGLEHGGVPAALRHGRAVSCCAGAHALAGRLRLSEVWCPRARLL